ncbi:MAG TPA: hypothetical protein VFL70_07720, partial [Bacteroidia bacterium]|nr:hypothetical protein [Bacteroidia bacterium]
MSEIFCKVILVINIFFVFLFKAEAQSVGGNISGATMVCPNMPNNGFLTLYNYTGTILTWEYSIDGGTTWTPNGNPTNSQNYSSLTVTTCYRAIVQDGIFQPDTSATACITIIPPSVGGVISGGGTFCVNAPADTLTLTGETGKVLYWQYSINGGISWTTITDTNTFIYHPVITQNTIYQVVVQNGVSCPYDTSSIATFTIDAQTAGGLVGSDTTVCYQSNGDT